jgi:integrase
MSPYLKLKGNRFHVRLRVPADVRWAFAGKSEVWRATGTGDRKAAGIKAHAHAAAFKVEVERARGKAPALRSADDPLIRLAMEWRGMLAPLEGPLDPDDGASEAALSATQDAAIEVAEKLPGGPQQALFVAVALHGRTPLATLVDAWGEDRRREDVKAKTADGDIAAVRRFVKAFPLAGHVSRAAVAQWLDGQRKDKSGAALQRETTGLRQFWRWLGRRGVFDPDKTPDPFAGLTFKGKANKRKPFTPAEVAALYKAALADEDHDLAKAIAIAAYTGARREEITSLEAPVKGWLEVKEAKTAAGIRRIPVASRLGNLGVLPAKGPVFTGLGNGNKYGDRSGAIGQRFTRLKVRLGHGEEKTFHSIRHTVVSALDDAGVPPHVVAALAGHERKDFTGRVYSGAELRKLVKGAVAKLRYPKPLA